MIDSSLVLRSSFVLNFWFICFSFNRGKHANSRVSKAGYVGLLSLSLETRHSIEITTPINTPFRLTSSLKIHLYRKEEIDQISSIYIYNFAPSKRGKLTFIVCCSSVEGIICEFSIGKWGDLANGLLPSNSPLFWLSTTFCNATINRSNKRAALFGTTTWKRNFSSIRDESMTHGMVITRAKGFTRGN